MSALMTICIRRRAVSLSWMMKCQKRDIFHVLHCHQDDDFEILCALGCESWEDGERAGRKKEGRSEDRLTVTERGNHRSAQRRWIETRDYTQTWLPVMHRYSFPLYYKKFSQRCSAASWLAIFFLAIWCRNSQSISWGLSQSLTFSLRRQALSWRSCVPGNEFGEVLQRVCV